MGKERLMPKKRIKCKKMTMILLLSQKAKKSKVKKTINNLKQRVMECQKYVQLIPNMESMEQRLLGIQYVCRLQKGSKMQVDTRLFGEGVCASVYGRKAQWNGGTKVSSIEQHINYIFAMHDDISF